MNTTTANRSDLDQAEGAELTEDDRPGVEEHDLDVEDDEDHRHEVEADGEPLRRLLVRHDAALVGRDLGRRVGFLRARACPRR